MPIEIKMPALSPTMTKGTLAKWLVKEGDKIKAGDLLVEVETDKAVMEVEATDSGVIGKIIKTDGTAGVAVGEIIAFLLEPGEDVSSLDNISTSSAQPVSVTQKPEATSSSIAAPAIESATIKPAAASDEKSANERVFASPLARKIADSEGVDLSSITQGSGPSGRIIKRDIEEMVSKMTASSPLNVSAKSQAKAGAVSPSPSVAAIQRQSIAYNEAGISKVPHNNIRKVVAARLLESKATAPHFYLTVDCDMTSTLAMRDSLNKSLIANGNEGKVSVNDIIIKATASALKLHPEINCSWTETDTILYKRIDISIAVSIPEGLITPIVFNAGDLSLLEISSEAKKLIKKARENKLKPNEFQGGTFSISNLGMTGVEHFYAIINPPQAAILAVGACIKRPVFDISGDIKEGQMMKLSLSVDHRVIDGDKAARFLSFVKEVLENPLMLSV